jgi:type VI secretion system protein ImpF
MSPDKDKAMASTMESRYGLSLMDLLLDEGPEQDRLAAASALDRYHYLRNCLRRDLEMLLNTRRRCLSVPKDLREVEDSLLTFGIPDFSGANLSSEGQRELFRQAVEDAIRRHESRFYSVVVTLLENSESLDRTLRFRIEAFMRLDETSEPELVFDSVLEPLTCGIAVNNGNANG